MYKYNRSERIAATFPKLAFKSQFVCDRRYRVVVVVEWRATQNENILLINNSAQEILALLVTNDVTREGESLMRRVNYLE